MWLWAMGVSAWAAASPQLVVVVVVDQYSLDLHRLAAPFYTDGLARLSDPARSEVGVGRYGHACTWTAPGHATIGTGASPAEHGIGANEWFEGDKVVVAGDPAELRRPSIGATATAAGRVVAAVSLKQRGAMLIAGADAPGAAWLTKQGDGYAWAGPGAARSWLPTTAKIREYESQKTTPSDAWPTRPERSPWEGQRTNFFATPAAGTMLVDAAIGALGDAELGLGADKQADLLVVSLSNIDYIGHTYTPESEESLRGLRQLDGDLGRLFGALDQRVGAGRWTLLLTADHGVLPTPAAYLSGNGLAEQVTARFATRGLPGRAEFLESGLWFFGIDEAKRPAYVEIALAEAARWPEIAVAIDVEAPTPPRTLAQVAVEACRVPGRSGDVLMWPRWGTTWAHEPAPSAADPFPGEAHPTGTSHGSPWAYDTDVPVLVTGAGVTPGLAPLRDQTAIHGRVKAWMRLP